MTCSCTTCNHEWEYHRYGPCSNNTGDAVICSCKIFMAPMPQDAGSDPLKTVLFENRHSYGSDGEYELYAKVCPDIVIWIEKCETGPPTSVSVQSLIDFADNGPSELAKNGNSWYTDEARHFARDFLRTFPQIRNNIKSQNYFDDIEFRIKLAFDGKISSASEETGLQSESIEKSSTAYPTKKIKSFKENLKELIMLADKISNLSLIITGLEHADEKGNLDNIGKNELSVLRSDDHNTGRNFESVHFVLNSDFQASWREWLEQLIRFCELNSEIPLNAISRLRLELEGKDSKISLAWALCVVKSEIQLTQQITLAEFL